MQHALGLLDDSAGLECGVQVADHDLGCSVDGGVVNSGTALGGEQQGEIV
jgi:hypothetical protein